MTRIAPTACRTRSTPRTIPASSDEPSSRGTRSALGTAWLPQASSTNARSALGRRKRVFGGRPERSSAQASAPAAMTRPWSSRVSTAQADGTSVPTPDRQRPRFGRPADLAAQKTGGRRVGRDLARQPLLAAGTLVGKARRVGHRAVQAGDQRKAFGLERVVWIHGVSGSVPSRGSGYAQNGQARPQHASRKGLRRPLPRFAARDRIWAPEHGVPFPCPARPRRHSRRHKRLESWKEIATYLRRDVTTVQRWEKREALPVHRHQHDRQGTVFAYSQELDAWLTRRQLRPDERDRRGRPSRRLAPRLGRRARGRAGNRRGGAGGRGRRRRDREPAGGARIAAGAARRGSRSCRRRSTPSTSWRFRVTGGPSSTPPVRCCTFAGSTPCSRSRWPTLRDPTTRSSHPTAAGSATSSATS